MEIKDIINSKPKKIEKIDDGDVIFISKSKMHLKRVNLSESELLFIDEVLRYVKRNNFTDILFLNRFKDGKPYFKQDNQIYILIDDLHQAVKIKEFKYAYVYCELLSKFHSSSNGYKASAGIKPSVTWGKRVEKYKNLYRIFDKYIDDIKNRTKHSEFEEAILKIEGEIKTRSKNSMKVFRSMEYINLLEKSMKNKEIILYDINREPMLKREDIYIISNIYGIAYGLYEEDLAMVIRKLGVKETDYLVLINEYNKHSKRQLNREVVEAYVKFPENTLKLIKKYKENKDEDILEKLEDALKKDGVRWIYGI